MWVQIPQSPSGLLAEWFTHLTQNQISYIAVLFKKRKLLLFNKRSFILHKGEIIMKHAYGALKAKIDTRDYRIKAGAM